MSNLATVTIQPSTEYQNLATLADVTFTSGKTYVLQVEGDVRLCEKATKPNKGGTRVNWVYPFDYEAGSDPIWVKNLRQFEQAVINISD